MDIDGGLDNLEEFARKVYQNDTFVAPAQRPPLPPRQTSYSKRHASFDSPREVPLPSPSSLRSQPFQFPTTTTTTSSHPHSPLASTKRQGQDYTHSGKAQQFEEKYSVFDTADDSGDDSLPSAPSSPRSLSPSPSRRPHSDLMEGIEPTKYIAPSKAPLSNQTNPGTLHTRDPSGGRHGSQAPQKLPAQAQPTTHQSHVHAETSSSSSSSSSPPNTPAPVFPFSRPYSLPESKSYRAGPDTLHMPTPLKPTWPDRSSSASLPLPMQTPFFTLPKVAAGIEEGTEWRHGTSSGKPEQQQEGLRPPPAPSEQATPKEVPGTWFPPFRPLSSPSEHPMASTSPSTPAMIRSPVVPSSILRPTPSLSASENPTIGSRSLSSSQASSRSSYPPPAPPTILTPPPPQEERTSAPYEPFLSHAPPPEDSWIAVETTQQEYTLVVRLPGFRRDGITLATRRRRILHVVADSWEPGGGHFERRISFGYDADLSQVRAEFDGELLRVIIPRRLPPMNAWYTPTPQQ